MEAVEEEAAAPPAAVLLRAAATEARALRSGASKGSEYVAAFIFPKVLCSQLAPSVGGKPVLGRLGRGTAKPGQSAPWMLTAPTEGDIAVAQKFDAYKATQVATVAAADSPW